MEELYIILELGESVALKTQIALEQVVPKEIYARALEKKAALHWARSRITPSPQEILFFPENFDPSQTYPMLEAIVPSLESLSPFFESAAQLGIIVSVSILDGNQSPTQFAKEKMREQVKLKKMRPYVDLSRRALMGFGEGAMHALYLSVSYPEQFKTALFSLDDFPLPLVSKYKSLLHFHYSLQSKEQINAVKYLFFHTEEPQKELLNSFIKIGLDFDLFLAQRKDSFTQNPFLMKKIWDYLVCHLCGKKIPSK